MRLARRCAGLAALWPLLDGCLLRPSRAYIKLHIGVVEDLSSLWRLSRLPLPFSTPASAGPADYIMVCNVSHGWTASITHLTHQDGQTQAGITSVLVSTVVESLIYGAYVVTHCVGMWILLWKPQPESVKYRNIALLVASTLIFAVATTVSSYLIRSC